MATNSKQARRDAERLRKDLKSNYENLFRGYYHNTVIVENLPEDLPKRYLLKTLMNKGGIAYDKQTKLFLPFVFSGIDIYGLPKAYQLVGYNGYTVWREPSEVVILRANDEQFPIANYLDTQIDKIVEFDMAISQNLEACKTMTILEVKDRATLLSMGNLSESRQIGASLAVVNAGAISENNFNVLSTGATYLVTNMMQDREKVLNETLSQLGISTSNTQKAERVQSMEVTASQGRALESIKTLIDTFNHDAEVGGLSIRLRGNTALYEDRELEVSQKEKEIRDEGENDNVEL